MKKFIYLIAVFVGLTTAAQNKKIIYGFDKIPQGLMVNPGAETTYKYHIGVPMLSGVSVHLNTSGITIADVFRDDSVGIFAGSDFNEKLASAIGKLDNNDYAYFNSQIEVLNGGYKINSKDYLSGGFYIETDVFATLPKDLAILATEGNAGYVGKTFDLSDAQIQAEVLGVFHVGLSRRFNEQLTAGARLKLYSGSTSVISNRNAGKFTTVEGTNSAYNQSLTGLDVALNTSGVYDENKNKTISTGSAIGGAFFGGNFGVGVDLGFTFHIDEQQEVTGSLLDFGTISYSKEIRNRSAKGDYQFSGVEFKYDNGNPRYWQDLEDEFNQKVQHGENTESYSVTRPLKANLMYSYSWGKSLNRATCHDNTFKDFFDNTVGGHIYAVSQPNGINLAYTAFYQRKLSTHLNLKATYTIDDFSYSNIGLGASLNIWKVNIYGTVGNIFGITDVADSHTFSSQLGVNFIMN